MRPLGDFLSPRTGAVNPVHCPEECFNLYSIPAYDSGIPERKLGAEIGSSKPIVQPGDAMVSRIVPHIRRSWVVDSSAEERSLASSEWLVFRHPDVLPNYLRYFFLSDIFHGQFMRTVAGVGGSLVRAKASGTMRIQIPVPPLAEQERIVRMLDEADAIRKLRAQADQRTADLIPALFHDMFDKVAYQEFTIGELLEKNWLLLHKDGNHGSLYPRGTDFGTQGVPFLSATCVTDEGTLDFDEIKWLLPEKASLLRHGWLEYGDVLLAHNATVGKVGLYEGIFERALIGTSLTAFRTDLGHIDPRYLWAALRHSSFQTQLERVMKQALRNQVPITAQRLLTVRIPELSIQRNFSRLVEEVQSVTEMQGSAEKASLAAPESIRQQMWPQQTQRTQE
jgi:type I restriction enzyme S subunit